MRKLLAEFKAFTLRGNVFELAVAFVLGLAFNAVVQSLVDDVIMNLVAALFGRPRFEDLVLTAGTGRIRYGAFLGAVVNLLIVAVALFLVIRVFNRAKALRGHEVEPPTTRACPLCVTKIPVAARRCPACTSEVEPLPG